MSIAIEAYKILRDRPMDPPEGLSSRQEADIEDRIRDIAADEFGDADRRFLDWVAGRIEVKNAYIAYRLEYASAEEWANVENAMRDEGIL